MQGAAGEEVTTEFVLLIRIALVAVTLSHMSDYRQPSGFRCHPVHGPR